MIINNRIQNTQLHCRHTVKWKSVRTTVDFDDSCMCWSVCLSVCVYYNVFGVGVLLYTGSVVVSMCRQLSFWAHEINTTSTVCFFSFLRYLVGFISYFFVYFLSISFTYPNPHNSYHILINNIHVYGFQQQQQQQKIIIISETNSFNFFPV